MVSRLSTLRKCESRRVAEAPNMSAIRPTITSPITSRVLVLSVTLPGLDHDLERGRTAHAQGARARYRSGGRGGSARAGTCGAMARREGESRPDKRPALVCLLAAAEEPDGGGEHREDRLHERLAGDEA